MIRRTVSVPVAALAIGTATLLGAAVSASFGAYQSGYLDGQLDAYRETNRVLHQLRETFAQLVQGQQEEGQEAASPEVVP